jgi:hypothetical protein
MGSLISSGLALPRNLVVRQRSGSRMSLDLLLYYRANELLVKS